MDKENMVHVSCKHSIESFTSTGIHLEITMLSEVNQTGSYITHDFSYLTIPTIKEVKRKRMMIGNNE